MRRPRAPTKSAVSPGVASLARSVSQAAIAAQALPPTGTVRVFAPLPVTVTSACRCMLSPSAASRPTSSARRAAVIARSSRAQPPLVRELIEKLFEQPEAGVVRHSRRPRLEKSQQGRASELAHALQIQRAHLWIETQHVLAAERKHPEALLVA